MYIRAILHTMIFHQIPSLCPKSMFAGLLSVLSIFRQDKYLFCLLLSCVYAKITKN